jgi:Ca2+/H+ antiporter, TMEM165/GDT1 family
MNVFLIAFSTIAIAEMGDRTQLLSLFLSAHFRKPWPVTAGIFLATLANHALAGLIGAWFGRYLSQSILDLTVGISMLVMAAWTLIPDKLDGDAKILRGGAFFATLVAFFIAEIGDKTQVATMALAAGYSNLPAIVAGTTTGMLAANLPVVFLGSAFARRLPTKKIQYIASSLFGLLGLYFVAKAAMHWLYFDA